jgi:hypothetical protein
MNRKAESHDDASGFGTASNLRIVLAGSCISSVTREGSRVTWSPAAGLLWR